VCARLPRCAAAQVAIKQYAHVGDLTAAVVRTPAVYGVCAPSLRTLAGTVSVKVASVGPSLLFLLQLQLQLCCFFYFLVAAISAAAYPSVCCS
jgi:hypothetical protein